MALNANWHRRRGHRSTFNTTDSIIPIFIRHISGDSHINSSSYFYITNKWYNQPGCQHFHSFQFEMSYRLFFRYKSLA